MFSRIGAVILLVSSMTKSIDFYKNVLGLELKSKAKNWVEFGRTGTVLALHPARRKSKSSKPRGGAMVAFKVGSMDEAYRMLKKKHVKFLKEPTEEEFGKHAIILDPDGYMISIAEPRIEEEQLKQALGYHGFTPV